MYKEELRDLLDLETTSKDLHLREDERGNTGKNLNCNKEHSESADFFQEFGLISGQYYPTLISNDIEIISKFLKKIFKEYSVCVKTVLMFRAWFWSEFCIFFPNMTITD